MPGVQLPLHIHGTHLRQRSVAKSVLQGTKGIFSRLSRRIAFNTGGGRRHHKQRAALPCTIAGNVSGMVTRGALTLVCQLLLLVHNDQSQGVQRRKHGAAGAQHDLSLSPVSTAVFIVALAYGQAAVQHRHLAAVPLMEQPQHLRSQSDLRHQHNGIFPLLQRSVNQAHIYLGLAAAGNAVQQRTAAVTIQHSGQRVVRLCLFGRQFDLRRLGGSRQIRVRISVLLFFEKAQHPALFHIFQHAIAYAAKGLNLLHGGAANVQQKVGNRLLLWR